MKRSEWAPTLEKLAKQKIDLSTRKNANYAGDENAWANFDLVETVTHGKITREQGVYVRMLDKVARLGNLLFGVEDLVGESTRDTVQDLAVYSDILTAMLDERRAELSNHPAVNVEYMSTNDAPPQSRAHLAAILNKLGIGS